MIHVEDHTALSDGKRNNKILVQMERALIGVLGLWLPAGKQPDRHRQQRSLCKRHLSHTLQPAAMDGASISK